MNTLNASLLSVMTCLSLSFCQSAMAGGFGNDVHLCPAGQPCITGYQSGNQIIFKFTNDGWDFFNVRYARVGGGEKQVENRSGQFTFNNVKPNRVYKLSVQGCNSHTLRRSTCSPWVEESVTTK